MNAEGHLVEQGPKRWPRRPVSSLEETPTVGSETEGTPSRRGQGYWYTPMAPGWEKRVDEEEEREYQEYKRAEQRRQASGSDETMDAAKKGAKRDAVEEEVLEEDAGLERPENDAELRAGPGHWRPSQAEIEQFSVAKARANSAEIQRPFTGVVDEVEQELQSPPKDADADSDDGEAALLEGTGVQFANLQGTSRWWISDLLPESVQGLDVVCQEALEYLRDHCDGDVEDPVSYQMLTDTLTRMETTGPLQALLQLPAARQQSYVQETIRQIAARAMATTLPPHPRWKAGVLCRPPVGVHAPTGPSASAPTTPPPRGGCGNEARETPPKQHELWMSDGDDDVSVSASATLGSWSPRSTSSSSRSSSSSSWRAGAFKRSRV